MDITLYKSNRWKLINRNWEGSVNRDGFFILEHQCSNYSIKERASLVDSSIWDRCDCCRRKPNKSLIVLLRMLGKKMWVDYFAYRSR